MFRNSSMLWRWRTCRDLFCSHLSLLSTDMTTMRPNLACRFVVYILYSLQLIQTCTPMHGAFPSGIFVLSCCVCQPSCWPARAAVLPPSAGAQLPRPGARRLDIRNSIETAVPAEYNYLSFLLALPRRLAFLPRAGSGLSPATFWVFAAPSATSAPGGGAMGPLRSPESPGCPLPLRRSGRRT